jgi:apolipoprotein D and lipocalin family protein
MFAKGTAPDDQPLEVVPYVDLQRYLGTWFEIATIPQRFQRGCVGVTAEYSLRKNGEVEVVNTCVQGTLDGEVRKVRGRARVVDKATGAKLKVSFFWPFWGSYWIIDLDKEYDYAVVGHPSRKYLWVLSRKPQMDDVLYYEILEKISQQGYDTSKLVKTIQK